MAENKMFTGAKAVGGRVPKWAWYVAGGVVIAGGVVYLRNRDEAAATEPTGLDESGAVGYTGGEGTSIAPGVIVPPVQATEGGVQVVETVAPPEGFWEWFMEYTASLPDLANGGNGGVNPENAPGGVVAAPPRPPTTRPPARPNPCSKLEGGFHCGDTLRDGRLTKRFAGAVGWKRDSAGGTGKNHWIKYRIRHCRHLEIWQVYPNRNGNPWNKTHQQQASNICG